ncbi:hypothetical protein MKK70_15295 [Methylobacterium sp. E-041]|uniref:hypothetical protein n=1 Tax=Methylobacterium sp. E-041 TaxID=2836573 RepID=UPI001FBBAE91|nr:hypothetical protein [Methylobacterium sp. E-041]MCJ2106718.1 hypothetical protein [Methylobacterium sp. E-041]
MPDEEKPKDAATHTAQLKGPAPKIEGSHTEETVDPAERLPEDPEEQNDLA